MGWRRWSWRHATSARCRPVSPTTLCRSSSPSILASSGDSHMVRRALVAVAVLAAPLSAQDTTRGVRIGLTYDAGTRPGVVVLPSRGAGADSLRAILQRDLDFGDRVNVIDLDAAAA